MLTEIGDVKHLNTHNSTVAKGDLIVCQHTNLIISTHCVIVPLSLHIRLDHPAASQLKIVVQLYFYTLDMDNTIQCTSGSCHQWVR